LKVATAASKHKAASKSSKKSSRNVLPREGRNLNIFHAENVTCKYVQISKCSDPNYYDTVFIGQSIYVPKVQNNSLTIFSPDEAMQTTISTGSLHSWDTKEIVALGIPRKGYPKKTRKCTTGNDLKETENECQTTTFTTIYSNLFCDVVGACQNQSQYRNVQMSSIRTDHPY
jgi:hypothetical protein